MINNEGVETTDKNRFKRSSKTSFNSPEQKSNSNSNTNIGNLNNPEISEKFKNILELINKDYSKDDRQSTPLSPVIGINKLSSQVMGLSQKNLNRLCLSLSSSSKWNLYNIR